MVLMAEPIFAAVEAVEPPRPLFLLGPGGRTPRPGHGPGAGRARRASRLLCGRYEGVDERVREHLVDGELSIGDYVLGGGEVAAMVVLEAVGRLVPGRDGQRRLGRRGVLQRRPARVPAVHPAGRVPGLGGARGAALRRPRAGSRAGAGPRPWPARSSDRPDLIEARGGLTDADRALLAELDR